MNTQIKLQYATLYFDDCMNALKKIENSSVHSVVTDPPYGLNFMGNKWDYDVPSEAVWRECLRVLKPGGHLLCFAGTRTHHRMAARIEDAGFEIRDMIAWVYGSGFPKSHNLQDDWQGWGTALKPALEPITMARKSLEGTVAENVLQHGTGALNIDGCRVDGRERTDYGLANSTRSAGNTYNKPSASADFDASKGRWPANIIHDGSEKVLAGFPITGPSPKQYTKKKAGWLTPGSEHQENDLQSREYGDTGSAARFFYCAKASKADRDEGCDGLPVVRVKMNNGNDSKGDPVSDRFTKMARNTHPTVKPTDLMRYLCRLVTPPNGIVLDPFMGSGSTGKAAMLEGFQFIGIEREAEYFDIACTRIERATNRQSSLW